MKLVGKTLNQVNKEKEHSKLSTELTELLQYLNETDWYYARLYETQKAVPIEVVDKRNLARSRISEIRAILNGETINVEAIVIEE